MLYRERCNVNKVYNLFKKYNVSESIKDSNELHEIEVNECAGMRYMKYGDL